MKLAISNIAWSSDDDNKIYDLMSKYGFTGLEIAPTRIINEDPYDNINKIVSWYNELHANFNLAIPSMQSIWFGKKESLFSSDEHRQILKEYTCKAIELANSISCSNLVFGCPRNRNNPLNIDSSFLIEWFKELGEYALSKDTCIGIEPNPTIYETNYINDFKSALDLVIKVNSEGVKVNFDLGSIIANGETLDLLNSNIEYISHVHISEPFLKPIKKRELHLNLYHILKQNNYNGYVSIEMGNCNNINIVEVCMKYISNIFSD